MKSMLTVPGLIVIGPLVFGLLAATMTVAAGDIERMALLQDREVLLTHQRKVGNVRAQARREGVIRNIPQLYAFHADHSQAFHMDGHRPGFVRELGVMIDRFRGARSMVALDTLLERTRTADGDVPEIDDLPAADVTLVVYRRAVCETCDRVEADLEAWLEDNPHLRAVLIRVAIDGTLPQTQPENQPE